MSPLYLNFLFCKTFEVKYLIFEFYTLEPYHSDSKDDDKKERGQTDDYDSNGPLRQQDVFLSHLYRGHLLLRKDWNKVLQYWLPRNNGTK